MSDDVMTNQTDEALMAFGQEFGKVLDPVAFLNEKEPAWDSQMNVQKRMALPKVGLFACFSGGSNTGSLTGMAALEVVRRLGNETVGICSLPAVLNQVPRQLALVQQIEKLVVVDGCHNACARQLLAGVGIVPDVYLNLETDLHLTKQGPFSSLAFTEESKRVAEAIITACNEALNPDEPLRGEEL